MSVELDPPELGFRRPFNREVSQVLKLRNPHPEPVAFKVKTTAPKQYCVRPNSGRIDAGGEVEVQVLLQAMKEEPPADAKCRDKFLVQSVVVAASKELDNIQTLWTNIEQTNRAAIQEKKIRVLFLPADPSSLSSTTAAAGSPIATSTPARDHTNGGTFLNYTPGGAPDTPDAVTPAHGTTPAVREAVGPVSLPEEKPAGSKSFNEIKEEPFNPADRAVPSEGTGAGASLGTLPTSVDDVKSQLAEAQATIARLTRDAQEGLRKRNVPGISSSTTEKSGSSNLAMQQNQAAAAGVPVQIVAGLCLLSFLLAYFFF